VLKENSTQVLKPANFPNVLVSASVEAFKGGLTCREGLKRQPYVRRLRQTS
jgi:hypothetical protein